MKGKYRYTLLTFMLSAGLVLGSMYGVNKIVQGKEKQLLTKRGEAVQQSPVSSFDEKEINTIINHTSEEDDRKKLSPVQIKGAIESWNNRTTELIHDPVKGQISMEEAIEKGKLWIYSMEHSINATDIITEIPSDINSDINSVRASLSVGNAEGQQGEQIEPYYSFWSVQYNGKRMSAMLYINAVTGEIWGAQMNLYEAIPDKIPVDSLHLFADMSGIESGEQAKSGVISDGMSRAFIMWNDTIEMHMEFSAILIDDNSVVEYYLQTSTLQEKYAIINYRILTKNN